MRLALGLTERELVAFTGGGGKTTSLQRLARELGQRGRRLAATTTTKMLLRQLEVLGQVVVAGDFDLLMAELRRRLTSDSVVPVGREVISGGKLLGLPEEWVEEVWNSHLADMMLVEADGSQGRSLKAPAEHEPVIPRSASLVIPVVGLDVLGRPLVPEFVHRPELVSRVAGIELHSPVTIEAVARVVTHPSGLGKGIPPGARVVPLINKVERLEDLSAARQLAGNILLLSPKISQVVLANCGGRQFGCEVVRK